MISKLLDWAIHSRVVVILLTCTLIAVGSYAIVNVNVEAYPDPAPAIIGVAAIYTLLKVIGPIISGISSAQDRWNPEQLTHEYKRCS